MTATLTATIAPPAANRAIFPDVLRSEWTKLRSVRSTYLTLLAAVGASVGVSALASSVLVNNWSSMSAADKATFDPTSFSLSGLFLAQLAIVVLGVMVITSEHSTGAIRSTFAAVPQRRTVLAAKAAVFSAVTLVVGMVSCFSAFFVGQWIMSANGIQAHIGDPGVLRSVAGTGLYLVILGLLALGVGSLIRHSAGAISAVFGVIFVLPVIVATLPSSWNNAISKFLPSSAGQAISHIGARGSDMLSPLVGLGVFCLYAALALAAAAIALDHRDA
jgi:ABC-2 type transport system permease protein